MAIRNIRSFRRHPLAAAAAALAPLALTVLTPHASAQGTAAQTITITGSASAANSAGIAGFGDVPLSRSPFSATVITTRQMQDAGIAALADITRLDAAITDAYNAPGYWGQVAVRGYTLDNRQNFRRDGLPVNAETVLPAANKAALELLKGTSGIQAGVSSPGGLLNLVVKRPTAQPLTQASVEWTQPGSVALEADVSRRAGTEGAFGWRLNAQATQLDPQTRNSRGHAGLLAGAVEWRLPHGALLEIEGESSRQSQPSTPGFSLLGNRLPDPARVDPRLNLNNQAWSLPVVFDGRTASLRYTLPLGNERQLVAHLMRQQLVTQDRIAFPFGCSAEDVYDRYCSDGRFDFYDFRSENERRDTTAADLAIEGRARWGGLAHRWSAGVLATRFDARFQRQAYNLVGTGTVDGRAVVPADPALTDENTKRDERSTEWRLQDIVTLSPQWQLWAGLRHTRLERASVRTDGSRPTDYGQSFTTPWLALAWQFSPQTLAYASWGRGVETEVAPNRARYVNAGQALPALQSRQVEAGLKHQGETLQWRLAVFDIDRPQWTDLSLRTGQRGSCSNSDPCVRRADGSARHRGVEAEAEWRQGPLSLRGSALWLHARREGAATPGETGLEPTNVPARSLKLQGAYNVAAVPGLAALAFVSHEGERAVLPDNSVFTDGWTRLDLGLRYARTGAGGTRWTWRAGLDNATDARAWKESPYQFGHAYLYPLAPRTWRLAVSATL